MPLRSPFTSDWPRYAVAAHVVFWGVAALFLASCLAGYAGLVGGQIVLSLFWGTIIGTFLLGVAGAASGRLYVGNQVFSRKPLTGWPARVWGLVVSAAASLIMFFAYALMQLGG